MKNQIGQKNYKKNIIDTTEENPYISVSTGRFGEINCKYMEKIVKNDEFSRYELEIPNARIKYFNEIINKNPEM